MEPGARKPMAIAAMAVLLVIVVLLKGFAPLVRFQVIQVLIARLRARRRARNTVSPNGQTAALASFRRYRLVVAIFGAPILNSTVDVEQANTAPPPIHFDPSISTPSLAYPPPAYTTHHSDARYTGPVSYNRPSTNVAAWRDGLTPLAFHPPPYASSPSLRDAPSTPTATS